MQGKHNATVSGPQDPCEIALEPPIRYMSVEFFESNVIEGETKATYRSSLSELNN